MNPALALRNWLAQRAIEQAEAGDMGELERLHAALADPFTDREDRLRPPPAGLGETSGSQLLELTCLAPRSAGRLLVRINFPAWVWRSR